MTGKFLMYFLYQIPMVIMKNVKISKEIRKIYKQIRNSYFHAFPNQNINYNFS